MFVSSPTVSSYFTSRPTSRKKMAMKMSLMMCPSDMPANPSPKKTPTSVCQKSRNASYAPVFATISARSMAPAAFVEECVNWMSLR